MGEKKKKSVENKLDNGESNSAPFLSLVPPLAFPSSVCTNTSCGRGFSCAARGMERIPAEQPRWASSALPDTGGSESTAVAVPCSAPDLQPPAAKGTAGGTGVWAEFQAIAPLGTCCFFFFFFSRPAWHARANDGRKTQQGRAKHKGSDRPSRDRQGQRVTPGLTQGGLTPSRGFSTCRELHGYKQLGFLLEGSWESPPGMLGARRGEVGAPWGAAKPGACNKSSSCQKIPTENNQLSVD